MCSHLMANPSYLEYVKLLHMQLLLFLNVSQGFLFTLACSCVLYPPSSNQKTLEFIFL